MRRVKNLHTADCLRANKSTAAWGLEVRVPFLDKDFLDVAMTVDPQEKMCVNGRIEKHVLRKAFDTPERPFLPHDILWRQKEQFSDGVGYSWINGLKAYTEKEVCWCRFYYYYFPLLINSFRSPMHRWRRRLCCSPTTRQRRRRASTTAPSSRRCSLTSALEPRSSRGCLRGPLPLTPLVARKPCTHTPYKRGE